MFKITSKIESRNFHHGQHDLTMNFYINNEVVGYIDYVEFQNEIYIQMIKVKKNMRRQGLGSIMMKELQKKYPDTEIELGTLTDDGEQFFKKIPYSELPISDVLEKQKELSSLKNKIKTYHKWHDELMMHADKPDFEKTRDSFMKKVVDWNDLYDRIHELEQDLLNKSSTKRIFR